MRKATISTPMASTSERAHLQRRWRGKSSGELSADKKAQAADAKADPYQALALGWERRSEHHEQPHDRQEDTAHGRHGKSLGIGMKMIDHGAPRRGHRTNPASASAGRGGNFVNRQNKPCARLTA